MPTQANVSASVTIAPETALNVAAAAGAAGAQRLRRVSTSLATQKASFASNEVRTDQQVADLRHGTRGAAGSIDGELSTVTYDPLLEAVMRGAWATGVTSNASAWTTPNLAITVLGTGLYRATFGASGGSLIALGYRFGDIVAFSGLTGGLTGLNGKFCRVYGLTATAMDFSIIDGTVLSASPTNATWTLAVVGSKLLNGVQKRSFTIEQSYDDIDVTELFTGMRVGGTSIRVAPNGMASASFAFQGVDGQVLDGAAAPYFTAPAPEGTTGILTGIGGEIRAAGSARGVITGLDLNVNCNLSAPPVIGPRTVPEIYYGRTIITGSLSFFLQDKSMLAAYLNEDQIDVSIFLPGAQANVDGISLSMQRVKLSGANKQVGPEGGLIVQSPFQALLAPGGNGYDKTTLCIQRTNAA